MNTLLYSARMALRDIYEVNVFTKGSDRVFLSISHDLEWGTDVPGEAPPDGRVHAEQAIVSATERLGEMDMMLAGGERAVGKLMDSDAVEIVRRVD